MDLPLHPGNAVPEALPLLAPPVAHYLAQWEKFMVKDPEETDTVGFWVPANTMPEHLAPLENWQELAEISWRHTPEAVRQNWFDNRRPEAVRNYDPKVLGHGDFDNNVVEPEQLGIELWGG
ncbi:MAG: hypothetical protein ACSLFB_13235 [Acidimicrobiales bacterium]